MLCINRRMMPPKKKGDPLVAFDTPVNASGASDNRNALSKDIYNRMFDWLFVICNGVLEPKNATPDGFVGLLDIFGFEIFDKNSIEQLCINFANELLQKLFNDHIFEGERKVYEAEGLSTSVIPPYRSNGARRRTPCKTRSVLFAVH